MERPHTLIVGAGASGAVIAARLSERSDLTVLLLEAGPDYLPAQLPSDLANGKQNAMSSHDWGFMHRPTPSMPLIPLPRGKVVGGSSAVNTCIALRGQPLDYDEWGLPGWTWNEVLPAFKRLEHDLDFRIPPGMAAPAPCPCAVTRRPSSRPGRRRSWMPARSSGSRAATTPTRPGPPAGVSTR